MLKLIFLFPHLSLLRNLSSIWALPYIKTFIRLPETILITFSLRSKMTFKDGRILKSLFKEESPLLRWICYLDLIFFLYATTFSPSRLLLRRSTPWFLSLSGMINVPELNLPHYNILIAQEDWLYQILNYIIGRSSLRPFIIGLILNLQFHGRVIEADKVKPNRLQDILFTGTGKKGDNYKFGPVVG